MRRALPEMAGCWIDSTSGLYGQTRLLILALDRGWRPDCGPQSKHSRKPFLYARALVKAYNQDVTVRDPWGDWITPDVAAERIINQGGLSDEAERWLNEHVAPHGFSFGWHDGDFMLCHDEWWEINQV